jgi:hypothetical protein
MMANRNRIRSDVFRKMLDTQLQSCGVVNLTFAPLLPPPPDEDHSEAESRKRE